MIKGQIERAMPHLGILREFKRLRAGAVNDVYGAKSSRYGAVILKCYDPRLKAQVRTQTELLTRLRLPVPRPMVFRGKLFFPVEGRLCVVYPKLPGVSATHSTKMQREDVGTFLARFHRIRAVRLFRGPKRKLYELDDARLCSIVAMSRQKRLPSQQLLRELVAEAACLRLPRSIPHGAIHVDVKPNNVLFQKGHLSGVLDFDNMYRGPFLLDLAKSMVWFGLSGKTFRVRAAMDILHEYERIRPLTSMERSLLHQALCFAFVSHIVVDFEMFAIGLTSLNYFRFITRDFYGGYVTFRRLPSASFMRIKNVRGHMTNG